MQYAFAYMHFMMNVREPFNLTSEFHALDTDDDGQLRFDINDAACN